MTDTTEPDPNAGPPTGDDADERELVDLPLEGDDAGEDLDGD